MLSRRLARTGLHVSAVGLGTMTWGRDTDPADARELLTTYLDAGGSLLDTAGSYGEGASEETIGELLGTMVGRSEVTLCSKSGVRVTADGAWVDAGRGALLDSLDASLARLGTDHLDLWLVQVPDREVAPEETVSALEHAVRTGRARYVGLANHPGWATAHLATLARTQGASLAVAQVEYSLLQRGAEREVLPAAASLGLGVIGWSALGRGVLTGKYRRVRPADSRAASTHLRSFVEPYLTDGAAAVVEAVATAASGLGRSTADVALAWARDAPGVASVLVGPRTPGQLVELLDAVDEPLPEQIRAALDDVTAPVLGYPERR